MICFPSGLFPGQNDVKTNNNAKKKRKKKEKERKKTTNPYDCTVLKR